MNQDQLIFPPYLENSTHTQLLLPSPSKQPVFLRPIRSFVIRSGRVTNGQRKALDALSGEFVLVFQKQILDWNIIFQREAPNILEIGFGMGDATAHIAKHASNINFLGIEVHEPGMGALLKHIHNQHLTNLRLIQHDAVEVVQHMIAFNSLDGVHIFFPDPWHKKRHHKRRLVQADFVTLLALRLKPGGYLHCATDCQDYAEQMLGIFNNQTMLINTVKDYAIRPHYRPITKFENRGLRLGHRIWDLIFKKHV